MALARTCPVGTDASGRLIEEGCTWRAHDGRAGGIPRRGRPARNPARLRTPAPRPAPAALTTPLERKPRAEDSAAGRLR